LQPFIDIFKTVRPFAENSFLFSFDVLLERVSV
jgi:hypothetical protein